MEIRGLLFGVLLAAGAAPAWGAKGEAPERLPLSTPWKVHSTGDFCRLMARFGEGKREVTVVIDRFGPGERFRLSFAGRPMFAERRGGTMTLRFGDTLGERKLRFQSGLFAGKPAWIIPSEVRIRPDDDGAVTAADEAAADGIAIGEPLRDPLLLETGSLGEPFAALRQCTDDMLAGWGIDAARHAALSRPAQAVGSPGEWIRSNDYPESMLRKLQSGIVQFRLTVGADGTPTACHIQQSTNPEGFDESVCRALMERARFRPALDAKGKPLASYYRSAVRFSIAR